MTKQLQKEYTLFCSHLQEFLKQHPNEFVLIKGTNVVDFYRTYEEALTNGLQRFGNVPFFIKDVKKEEEVHIFCQGVS